MISPVQIVLEVGQHFFSHLCEENFGHLFKLNPTQVQIYLNSEEPMRIRNFLIFLFWCRHYLPMRSLAVLFHLSKSSVCRIVHAEMTELSEKVHDYVRPSYPFFVLGDKGYEGCSGVYYMKKRKRGQIELTLADQDHNDLISTRRVEIEQFFAQIKNWKVINHVYRGELNSHVQIFYCCVILTHLSTI